eukprot:scaffold9885_cov72-Skeletonema_dohrnii-CCMP3373.AAC.1
MDVRVSSLASLPLRSTFPLLADESSQLKKSALPTKKDPIHRITFACTKIVWDIKKKRMIHITPREDNTIATRQRQASGFMAVT